MIYLVIALAAVAVLATWKVISLQKSLTASQSDLTASRIETERARSESAVELATARQLISNLQEQIGRTEQEYRLNSDTLNTTIANTREALSQAREENARLATSLAHFEEERESHERQLEERFRNLANDILKQNSADFKAQNEQRLEEILSPLRTNLDDFRKTVTDTYNAEARERFSLTDRIRELVELNNTISREARELTLALRGNNQVQGDWGKWCSNPSSRKADSRRDRNISSSLPTTSAGHLCATRRDTNCAPTWW